MIGVKIHDIECLVNLFLYCDVDRDTGEEHTFLVWGNINELPYLVQYLRRRHKLVGFNNHSYDGQMLQYILDNADRLSFLEVSDIVSDLYTYSQSLIADTQYGGYPPLPAYKLSNKHLDLYKLWHFDNKNRATRLKDLQVAMDWKRVQDMPIKHYETIEKADQVAMVIDYCKNDIYSTLEFYKRSKAQIDLRTALSKTFGLDLMSANDPKIGSEVCAKLLSQAIGIPTWELKKMRTHRDKISLGELLLPYIKFDDPILRGLLAKVRSTIIHNTKGDFREKVKLRNLLFEMALGGIHACVRPGIYRSDSRKKILDIDVKSFYPNLAIVNRLYPEHLGTTFCDVFEMLYNDRDKIPKKDPRNYAYKIILNGAWGKSNDNTSYFYDPKFTMQITINGQLLILMLSEKITALGCDILQANTDGITVMYDEDKEEDILEICRQWCKVTRLQLEYASYERMIIRDVNNYIAVGIDGNVKRKGAFELFDTTDSSFKDWNKDPSFRIVSKAVNDYFIKGVEVDTTIKECKDIFQFGGRAKFKSDSEGETRCFDGMNITSETQQKTTRYLVTNKGCSFHKVYIKGKEEVINKGYLVTIYNDHIDKPFDEYDINYKFYIEEANKIIRVIEGNKQQLTMF